LGRNGVGKTTLLKCLMGLIPAKTGEVLWQGKKITHSKPHQRAVRRGVCPAGAGDFPAFNRGRKPAAGAIALFRPRGEKGPGGDLAALSGAQRDETPPGGDLSGGQQQQLAIGRALASRPQLLILDEPTEGIQPSVIKEIGQVIRQLADRGDMAILLVEQFYDFAAELADSYLLMSRGTIIQRGRGENMEQEGVRGLVAI
jgi:urea transport system ATP-binding protein